MPVYRNMSPNFQRIEHPLTAILRRRPKIEILAKPFTRSSFPMQLRKSLDLWSLIRACES